MLACREHLLFRFITLIALAIEVLPTSTYSPILLVVSESAIR
jgi:hypothetical protein